MAGFIAPLYLFMFHCGSLLVYLALFVGDSSVDGWWELVPQVGVGDLICDHFYLEFTIESHILDLR